VQLKIIASRGTPYIDVIVEYGDESDFPNFRIALQAMLTIALSTAS